MNEKRVFFVVRLEAINCIAVADHHHHNHQMQRYIDKNQQGMRLGMQRSAFAALVHLHVSWLVDVSRV